MLQYSGDEWGCSGMTSPIHLSLTTLLYVPGHYWWLGMNNIMMQYSGDKWGCSIVSSPIHQSLTTLLCVPGHYWWLGMTDELVEGHWRWINDNTPVTYFGEHKSRPFTVLNILYSCFQMMLSAVL